MKKLRHLLLSLLFISFGLNAFGEGVYKVSNVKVSAIAVNAKKARVEAIEKAQLEAFLELVKNAEYPVQNVAKDKADILGAAREFQILSESISKSSYSGVFDVYFSKSHLDKILSNSGVAPSSIAQLRSFLVKKENNPQDMLVIEGDEDETAIYDNSKDINRKSKIVIPISNIDGKTLLWDERNLWLKQWKDIANIASEKGLIVPLGDLEDIADSKFNILLGNYNSFKSLLARYKADEVLIAFADIKKSKGKHKITVSMKSLNNLHEHSYLKEYFEISGTSEDEMLSEAVYKAIDLNPEEQYDVKNLEIQISDNIEVEAIFNIKDFSEWIALSTELSKVPSILKATIAEFNSSTILVNIVSKSDLQTLRKNIGKHGTNYLKEMENLL